MRIGRIIKLSLSAMFTILTFHKFYICEDCHKIHRFTGNEFPEFDIGVWKKYIFVNNECAEELIDRVASLLAIKLSDSE
jgi:hypothetical protein